MFSPNLSRHVCIIFYPVGKVLLALALLTFEPLILCFRSDLCIVGYFTAFLASAN